MTDISPSIEDLKAMDTIEAIQTIEKMEKSGNPESLPALFQYIDLPDVDDAVVIMAKDLTIQLLKKNEKYLLQGLENGGENTREICIHVAGEVKSIELIDGLVKYLESSEDQKEKQKIICALSNFNEDSVIKKIVPFLGEPDALTAIAAFSALGDSGYQPAAVDISNYLTHEDPLYAYASAEALGKIGGSTSVEALGEQIHHDHPVVRKAVLDSLVSIGKDSIPKVITKLKSSSDDEVIMAANILGFLGEPEAIDPLKDVLGHSNSNIRFAGFEALGRIPSLKASMVLLDGLQDKDYSTLCAVTHGIDNNCFPQVTAKVQEVLLGSEEIRKQVISAIVDTRSTGLFRMFIEDRRLLKDILVKAEESKNLDTLEAFFEATESIENVVTKKGSQAMLRKAIDNLPKAEKKVLAADDSKTVRFLLESMLPQMGYQVVTVEDGQIALHEFKKDQFDLVLLDMNMPNKSGIEAAETIRHTYQSSVPIIMITTESQSSQVEAAKKAGVSEFMTKPFTLDDLSSCIGKVS